MHLRFLGGQPFSGTRAITGSTGVHPSMAAAIIVTRAGFRHGTNDLSLGRRFHPLHAHAQKQARFFRRRELREHDGDVAKYITVLPASHLQCDRVAHRRIRQCILKGCESGRTYTEDKFHACAGLNWIRVL
jgi:hypothetical protein